MHRPFLPGSVRVVSLVLFLTILTLLFTSHLWEKSVIKITSGPRPDADEWVDTHLATVSLEGDIDSKSSGHKIADPRHSHSTNIFLLDKSDYSLHNTTITSLLLTPLQAQPWRTSSSYFRSMLEELEQKKAQEGSVPSADIRDSDVPGGVNGLVDTFETANISRLAAMDLVSGIDQLSGKLAVHDPDSLRAIEADTISMENPEAEAAKDVNNDGDWLLRVDSLISVGIEKHAFPGAAVAIGRAGVITALKGYGYYTYNKETPITPSSLFDIASLTKAVATTTAAMLLYEEGRLDLDSPVFQYLPEFAQNDKKGVTIRHLLSHSSGLPSYRPFHTMGLKTRQQVIDAIMAEGLQYRPGTKQRYSDLGMIVMALVIEEITSQDFGYFCKSRIFEPLGMTKTGFRPVGNGRDPAVVPTENDRQFRKRLIQGEVHDETAYLLGGTAGNAGIFSTAEDLARFAYMLVNDGQIDGKQFLKKDSIELFTTRVKKTDGNTRALGWDTRGKRENSSAGRLFGPRSYGHTGFTGTSLWIDPDQKLFVLLLTNRVYPSRNNSRHVSIRSELADIAYSSIMAAPVPIFPVLR